MIQGKRSLRRPVFFVAIVLALLFLAACGSRVDNVNWPGLSTNGETIYLANGPGVSAYDAATQALQWSFPAEPQASLQFYSAPSVEGDRIIFGDYGQPGGFFSPQVTVSVYAVEQTDDGGAPPELWSSSVLTNDKIVAPPLQVGDVVYVGTADNYLLAIDAVDGSLLWDFKTGHSVWGQAAFWEDTVLVASMDRTLYALDAGSGNTKWETSFNGAMASGPVLNDNLVYVPNFDSHVHALDVSDGSEHWSFETENWVWGSPAYHDGALYFADIDGNVYAVDAQTGAENWRQKAIGAVQTSPTVSGDVVYVASEGESSDVPAGALTAFAIEDGREIWQRITPAPLFTTPVVVDDAVVVALTSEESILMGFDRQTGGQLWTIAPPETG